MVEKYARTIDGMRVRVSDSPKQASSLVRPVQRPVRSVPTRSVHSVPVRPAQRKAVTPRRQVSNVGLSRDGVAAEKARLRANEDFLKPVSTLDFDLSSKDLRPDYSLKKRSSSSMPARPGKKNRVKKNGHKAKRILLTLLAVIVMGGGVLFLWGNNIIAKLTGGRSGILELIGAMSSNVKLKTDEKGRTNVLVFGTSGYDMKGTVGEDGEHDGAQLTDSIMVVSLDQETKDLAMVSLPRDLYVGNTCTATGKVNEVYYCSNLNGDDEEGGAKALESTISEIFDIEIQYRAHVDWGALIQAVDSIGGITVTLDEDIEDDWTGTFIKAGEPVDLNGEQALGLARARHGTEMGDFTRGNSQQKILKAIQDKIVKNGISLSEALNLVDAVGDNVRMNFSIEELKTIYNIAKDTSLDAMRQVPLIDYGEGIEYLTTAEMNEISYVVPSDGISNYDSIQTYIHRMFSSDPGVREEARIAVLNGSGKSGAALKEQARLSLEGFSVVDVSDAPDGIYDDKYYIYDITGNAPASARSLAERYSVEILPGDQLPEGAYRDNTDIIIIVGGSNDVTIDVMGE